MSTAFEVMRAKDYAERRVGAWSDYYAEVKLNGVRVICTVSGSNRVTFYSRNCRKLDMFSHLERDVRKLKARLSRVSEDHTDGIVIDGEMCGDTFGEIGGAIHRKNHTEHSAVYTVFHTMPLSRLKLGEDSASQSKRRRQLIAAMDGMSFKGVEMVRHHTVRDHGALLSLYDRTIKAGHEGLVLKNMAAPWQAKRSTDWLKLKESKTEDLPIVGWKPGRGKYAATLGAIVVDRSGKRVSLSGMGDEVREYLYRRRKKLETGVMVAEVEFQEVTAHGSLRHPRFVKLRLDKEKT